MPIWVNLDGEEFGPASLNLNILESERADLSILSTLHRRSCYYAENRYI